MRLFVLFLLPLSSFLSAHAVRAQAPAEQSGDAKKVTAEEIERLVKQLNDDKFAQRKSARNELLAIGEPALGAIRKVAETTDDLDLKTAAAALAEEIEKKASGLVRTFEGHRNRVNGVAIDGAGKRALSASWDGYLRLWDIEKGELVKTMPGKQGALQSVVFSPDGKSALTGSAGQRMALWDLEKGDVTRLFIGHPHTVWDVAFSPDGKSILSGCSDGSTRLWDAQSGEILQTLPTQPRGRAWAVAFTPDGKYAASGGGNLFENAESKEASLYLWDLKTGKEVRQFKGHKADVRRLAVSPDGKQLLSGSFDGTMRLWDIESGKEIRVFKGPGNFVEAVAFTRDGKRAVCAYGPQVVEAVYADDARCSMRVWDLETGKEVRVIRGHTAPILCVAISPDGQFVLSGSADNTMRLWKLPP